MTELLKKAFAEAFKLPEDQQDAVAAVILAEIESEAKWDAAFAKSQKQLEFMAEEALKEHRAGKTRPIEFDDD